MTDARSDNPAPVLATPAGPETSDGLPMLLTARGAADTLAISPRKLWELTKGGSIPCVRIGRAIRYDPGDLRDWIGRQKSRGGGLRNC